MADITAENDYEVERLRVIADNQKLLESLGLDHFASSSPSGSGRNTPDAPSTKRKREYTKEETEKRRKLAEERKAAAGGPRQSTRQSTRLMGLKVDDEESLAKHAEEMERQAEVRRVQEKLDKKVRYQTMTLEEMCDDPPKTSLPRKMSSLAPVLQQIASTPHPRQIATTDPFTQSKSKSQSTTATTTSTSALTADTQLRAAYKKTKLIAAARVCPERIYTMAIHPEKSKTLVFVGDKRGTLGFWDALQEVEKDGEGSGRVNGKGVKREEKEIVKKEGDGEEQEEEEQEEEEETPLPRTGDLAVGSVWRIQAHAKNSISCLKVDPVDATNLYTSAYDNSFRSLSLKDGKSIELLSVPDEDCLLTNFDLTPTGQEAWIVDSQGGITHLDMREGGKEAWGRRRWVTSLDRGRMKIGGVSVNPVSPWILSTASNDRTMKIWDTRQLSKVKCKPVTDLTVPDEKLGRGRSDASDYYNTYPTEECDNDRFQTALNSKAREGLLMGTGQHGQSCSSAYWDPWGKKVLTTSYDDRIRVFDLDSDFLSTEKSPEIVLKATTSVKHDCQCGRWVSILKAAWSPCVEYAPHFSVGNMKRRISVYSGLTGSLIGEFGSSLLTAVPAVTCSHPSIVNTLAGGTNSGKCQLWAEPVE